MDRDEVEVHKNAKMKRGQYPAILTSRLVNNIYIQRYGSSQRSKCAASWVHNNSIQFNSICLSPQYQRQRKCLFFCFFWEDDQGRDTKKEQALYMAFSQSDWFIAENERFSETATSRMPNRLERLLTEIQLQMFSYGKHSSRIIITLQQNINIGICNGTAMEDAIWKDQSTRVRKK